MEIYLKHNDRKQFIKIAKEGKGSVELDIYHNSGGTDFDISHSIHEDEQPYERHNYYAVQQDQKNINGQWSSVKAWEKSSKEEFMTAYASAQNTLLTIIQKR